jgi:SAM-dependent methyltransferase
MDVVDHREFYGSRLGRISCRLLTSALRPIVTVQPQQLVLGLGYATPYLDLLVPQTATSIAFMLAKQGVIHWPRQGEPRSALVDECDMPLLESVADHVIAVHALERSENPTEMLHEIWRVMAPLGRLVLVVPNRRGLWSATDTSPFGYGQPFSRSQLTALLKEAKFSILQWKHALFVPPSQNRAMLKVAATLERLGPVTANRFSGVIIVEATKQVYAFSSGKRARRFVPQLKPALLPGPRSANRLACDADTLQK